MTDRWNDVERIVQSALTRAPHERAAFVAGACAGDSALLTEVESLLARETATDHLLSTPAAALMAMSEDPGVFIGRQFGGYTILELLGVGGMGEVYRARDHQLDRDVAVKILPPLFINDSDRLARFEREAKILAALNHPHIGAIYGLERVDGAPALVLELVEGPTLAERLSQGALDIKDALLIAMQIADALEVAHCQGIIHRDLKPANIKVTTTGLVKLLDFGLAKGIERDDSSGASEAVTVPVTTSRPGLILGTAAYMSPEQARGEPVDARSDLFSLGAVLYEMVTGRPAFSGDTASAILRAILHDTPSSPRAINLRVPAALENVVMRLLAKDRGARPQQASAVRIELQRLASELDAGSYRWLRRWRRSGGAAAAIILVGIGILGQLARQFRLGSATTGAPPLVAGNASQLTAEDGLEIHPAISPDGRFVAYSAGSATRIRIFIRAATGGRAIPLSDDSSAFQLQPRWSPDGTEILYVTADGAFVTPAFGGTPRRITSSTEAGTYSTLATRTASGVTGATWSPDGRYVAIASGGSLSVVAVDGRIDRHVAASPYELHSCDWSPSGKWIACASGNWLAPGSMIGNIAPSAIVVVPATGGELIEVTDRTALHQSPVWSSNSQRLYFVSNRQGTSDIYSIEIAEDGRGRGDPVRVTTGMGAYSIAVSHDRRRLAYAAYFARANVWSLPVPLKGPVDTSGADPVTSGNQIVESVRVSRDGRWLIYDSNLYGNADIFRVPIARGPIERLTTDASDEFAGDLSPDGRWLTYHSWRTKSRDIFVQPVDGGPVEQLTSTPSQESYPVWSPDGRAIAFVDQFVERNISRGLFVVRRDQSGPWGEPVGLRAGTGGPSWSPDGRFLAYPRAGAVEILSPDSGVPRVIYTPSDHAADPIAESVRIGEDGGTLYFKSHDAQGRASIWSLPVSGGRPSLRVRFDNLSRPSNRPEFAVGAGRFYFTIEDRQSDIWIADVTEQ